MLAYLLVVKKILQGKGDQLANLFIIALLMNTFIVTAAFGAGSGGFRVEVPDAAAFGMGSAFVGEADTPAAIYYNPAGITQLKGYTHLSLGDAVITPYAKHTNSGIETQARINTQHVPHLYVTEDFGLERFNFGIGTGVTYGSITDWAGDSSLRYNATRSELLNTDLNLVGAYEVFENFSFAVGFKVTESKINKNKKLVQDSGANPDADYKFKADDIGYGYTLSGLYKVNTKHSFGFQYRSEMDIEYEGKTHLGGLFGTYAAVFGSDSFVVDTDAKLEIPQSAAIGYSYKPNEEWTFNFDVEWTDWSSVESENLIYKNSLTTNQNTVLTTGLPLARDWNSVWSYATGVEYQYTPKLALRAGYYYHQNAIPSANFGNELPDSDSHGITGGIGYKITDNLSIDLAYSALFFEDREVSNNVATVFGGDVDGEYEQWVSLGLATLTMNF